MDVERFRDSLGEKRDGNFSHTLVNGTLHPGGWALLNGTTRSVVID